MTHLFYNFCFGNRNKGYYYLRQTKDSLFSKSQFFLEKGELYTNIFELKLNADKVLAYKHQEGAWIDFRSRSENHYPSSAYPLILSKAMLKPFAYQAVSEHNDSSLGETVLSFNKGEMIEKRAAKVTRRFVMQHEIPVTIDWGGPISHLCKDAHEAVEGSGLAILL